MKLVFLFPFLNSSFGTSIKWPPLSAPTLVGRLEGLFPGSTFAQYDLEEECRSEVLKYRARLLDDFNGKGMDLVLGNGHETHAAFLSGIVNRLKLGEHDHYLFAFYNWDKTGVLAQLLLAKYLKTRYPDKKIIFGGVSERMEDPLTRHFKDLRFIDSLVSGPGERPLAEILRRLSAGKKIARRYTERDLPEEPEFARFSGNPPDFRSFKSLRFFSYSCGDLARAYNTTVGAGIKETGKRVLFIPYRFSSGCFWGKCSYCAESGRTGRREKTAGEIVDDIIKLKETYGTKYFLFYNPNFNSSLAFSKKLLRSFIDNKLDILWTDSFNLRVLDDELIGLLAEAGCFRADIGVTTLDPEVQKIHGNILRDNRDLINLKKLSDRGVWTHINLIANLPYQYSVEEDKRVLNEYMRYIDGVSLNSFRLYKTADLNLNRDKYGLKPLPERTGGPGAAMRLIEKDFPGGVEERGALFDKNYAELRDFFDTHKDFPLNPNQVHLYLLGHLYDRLGFAGKKKIKKIVSALTRPLRAQNWSLGRWRAAA